MLNSKEKKSVDDSPKILQKEKFPVEGFCGETASFLCFFVVWEGACVGFVSVSRHMQSNNF